MFYHLYVTFELTHRLYDILKYGATAGLKALCFIQLLNKFLEVLWKLKQNIHLEGGCQLQGRSVFHEEGNSHPTILTGKCF